MHDLLTNYPRSTVLGGLFLLLTGFILADPPLEALDLLNVRDFEAEVQAANAYEEQLDRLDEAVTNRMMIKDHLIANLLEGETSLRETIQLFLAMKRGDGNASIEVEPGTPLQVAMARHVYNYALGYLEEGDSEHKSTRERLDCELAEFLAVK